MIRKYLPYFLLLLAACLYLFIRTHQRGPQESYPMRKPGTDAGAVISPDDHSDHDFNRDVARIIYSRHAHCRMDCRHINEDEVKEILRNGKVNQRKIETDGRGTTYPLEGTAEGHHLRIVFAPKGGDAVEVVTCIDLDHEWPCNCN